jgi:hypothetical protein
MAGRSDPNQADNWVDSMDENSAAMTVDTKDCHLGPPRVVMLAARWAHAQVAVMAYKTARSMAASWEMSLDVRSVVRTADSWGVYWADLTGAR